MFNLDILNLAMANPNLKLLFLIVDQADDKLVVNEQW